MDKIKEILEKSSVRTDTKARRRVNTSKKVANITIAEIEAGVTIEKLASLNVPVYRYQTQITIHGKLPNIENEYIGGYKCLVENGNGTIGVRYIAIDGEKKELIGRAYWMGRLTGTRKMGYNKCSTGVSFQKRFTDKTECFDFLKTIPDIYIGSKYACQDVYGCFWVVVEFMAIEEQYLWEFINWMYAIPDLETLEKLEDAVKKKRELEDAERKIERDKAESERNEKIERVNTKLSTIGTPATIDPKKPVAGTYCKFSPYNSTIPVITIDKASNGQLKYSSGYTLNELKSASVRKKSFSFHVTTGQWFKLPAGTTAGDLAIVFKDER